MKIIFGTTNSRKRDDLQDLINEMNLDMEVLSMKDIGWGDEEIEETGTTIQENSLIKAQAIFKFCKEHGLEYPIITDDAGLFVDALDGRPGVYTARYADDETAVNPTLPKYQCVVKLLRELNGEENRKATYRCCVTTMLPTSEFDQVIGETEGTIEEEMRGEIKKPYFYSVFKANGTDVTFNQLNEEQLKDTYRHVALRNTLSRFTK